MSEPLDRAAADSAANQRRGDQYMEEGNLPAAKDCYRLAIAQDPRNGMALFNLGIAHFREQAYGEAEQALRQALDAGAPAAPSHYFLGTALHRQEKLEEAISHFTRALEIEPGAEVIYGDLCQALFAAGRREAAATVARQAAAASPRLADLHIQLGNLYAQARDFDNALRCHQERLALDPGHVHATYFAAEALQNKGALDEAADYYRKVIAMRPDFAEAWNNLGGICLDHDGDPQRAIECYQRALALRPDIADIHHNLGLACKACGRFDEAARAYRQALALKPEFAEAHANLASLLLEQGRHDEAIAHYRKALEIRPHDANACYGMGSALVSARRNTESLEWFRQAVALEPGHFTARAMLLHLEQQMCRWDDLETYAREVRHAIASAPLASKYKLLPLVFLAIPGANAAEQKYCAERYSKVEFGALAAVGAEMAFAPPGARREKIRIGYLSADFREHPVSFLMAEVFELHDRARFHVTAYSYGPDDGSPMRKRLEQAFDDFVDLREVSYEAAARRIHENRTDILVDLTGHTDESRSGILALRPAPVQVNYLGYPGTMGAAFIDYMIADRFTVPEAMRQHYSEEIVWLPDCFQANDSRRPRPAAPSRRECGLPEQGFVFCCFNQTFKITPAFFDIWCRLLREAPGSVLWIPASTPEAEGNLRREAAKRGVAAERIVMAALMPRNDHLARLQCADLFLDTLPFNAGTTCSDALWMGLPVVTCAGDAFASRMAGSLLTAMGVPELVAGSTDEYFSLALALATDDGKYRAVRGKIMRNRDDSPLFDTRRFTRNLEDAFVGMLHKQDEKPPAAH